MNLEFITMGKTFRRAERRNSTFLKKKRRMSDVRNWLGPYVNNELWEDFIEEQEKKSSHHHPFSKRIKNCDRFWGDNSRKYKTQRYDLSDLE
jgi:hypothetical protein